MEWLERLQVHLRPLEREGIIERWDDTMIRSGTKWREEIGRAIESTMVAVLLVSADFLASDFIATEELPRLLAIAEREGVVILPVIISPSRLIHTRGLSRFQTVNPPSRPLIEMTRGEQERVFLRVTEAVEDALFRGELDKVIDAERKDDLVETANRFGMRERVIDYLAETLHQPPDPTERYWIYVTLGEIGGPIAESLVREGLSDDNEFACLGAKEAWKNWTGCLS